ncbi:hypothetical protein L6164_024337 [Bauhinia variegata]|uniref:Uncharacterized protein n=1 Tax=Bauhinia variegata TaxID=167791 RepID=A0ACB9LWY9_BAUVA|nr:hypothetical protein L6164_024337 [Bauhinia variegata]
MGEPQKLDTHRILTLLEALREASKDLHVNPIPFLYRTDSKAAIEAILELETKATAIFSADPNLHKLSELLCNLRALVEKLQIHQGYGPQSLIHRLIANHKISQVAYAIESDIQSCVDRLTIEHLVKTLKESARDDEKVKALIDFKKRLSKGFDIHFQDLILRAKVFPILEHILCDSESLSSIRVREHAAVAIDALVRFNKNVFVGLVLMGPIIKALITMTTSCSIQVLSSLVRFIRIPLVSEIFSNAEIPRIINLLRSKDLSIQVATLDCVLELAYIGRKEVIEAMIKEDLIKKLIHLQKMEHGSRLIEMDSYDELETEPESNTKIRERGDLENFPFASCVSRFAIQLEVGEGLSAEEKTEFKLEILRNVREGSESDAELDTIKAEILWGSSP